MYMFSIQIASPNNSWKPLVEENYEIKHDFFDTLGLFRLRRTVLAEAIHFV